MPWRRDQASDPGRWIAGALAVVVHAAFLIVLIVSVSWRSNIPEVFSAELYAPPVIVETPPPPPTPTPKPTPPPPKEKEAPPPPPPAKPDIALKRQQELEKKRKEELEKQRAEELRRQREEAARLEAERKAQEQKRAAEAKARQEAEAKELQQAADEERKAQQERQRQLERKRAADDYYSRIQAKIRGNVIVPPDMPGNPEAIFNVVQLPTGEIIDATLQRSSGVRAYDDAVYRAIMKSSPLPKPPTPDLFVRNLQLKFRPLD